MDKQLIFQMNSMSNQSANGFLKTDLVLGNYSCMERFQQQQQQATAQSPF